MSAAVSKNTPQNSALRGGRPHLGRKLHVLSIVYVNTFPLVNVSFFTSYIYLFNTTSIIFVRVTKARCGTAAV